MRRYSHVVNEIPRGDVVYVIGDWNAKVGQYETNGITRRFGLGEQNERGDQLVEFCSQTCQVSRITRESHGFWQFLKAHVRETQCSRVFVNLTECCDQGILFFFHAD